MNLDPMTSIDGYKFSHRKAYPPGTEKVYSNWTARGSRVPGIKSVTLCGLQYFLKRYLGPGGEFARRFFAAPRDAAIVRYQRRIDSYLGPSNGVGTEHVGALHELGYLPLEFRAIPEGSSVPLRVPQLTLENTHPGFAWLTNYVETLMSCILWMPCTSATRALHMRKMLNQRAKETGTPREFVDWQGHDFSFRGMPGVEAAVLSGMGHLLAFTGTDTVPAIEMIEQYYPAQDGRDLGLIGASVPATEHSVMCAGGKEDELATFRRLLGLYPAGIVSVVSDTWDLWKVLTEILPALKQQIMAREGKLVIRPDSGVPVNIVCGDPEAPPDSPAGKGVVQLLWEVFGGTYTSTGHKQLDSHVGCIYGDGISHERADAITARLAAQGFATGNIVFGVGSWTYQLVTRDTFEFAMKSTWAQINGKGIDLHKQPVTDGGTKFSARGRLAVTRGPNGVPILLNQATPSEEARSILRPVWRDGALLVDDGFDTVRARAQAEIG